MKKKILFLTGTRADYGKLKPLIRITKNQKKFQTIIFSTGMHLLKNYGSTYIEILKDFKNINLYKISNQKKSDKMDKVLINSLKIYGEYFKKIKPDLVVIHGDRIETLAASIYCNLNNILIAHIEGGEVSGTVDESLRHATSKLSHVHFVSNQKAKKLLIRLGELKKSIHIIGSPEVDTMISKNLPNISQVKERYDISFDRYGILLFHPVTTVTKAKIFNQCKNLFNAIQKSKKNFVIIFPNNDNNSDIILKFLGKLKKNKQFKILPSLRFEHYLSLLKNSDFIIGNSSSGVREASGYGIYSINLGNRQHNRVKNKLIINSDFNKNKILNHINNINKKKLKKSIFNFGYGNSAKKFLNIINSKLFWKTKKQKFFAIN